LVLQALTEHPGLLETQELLVALVRQGPRDPLDPKVLQALRGLRGLLGTMDRMAPQGHKALRGQMVSPEVQVL